MIYHRAERMIETERLRLRLFKPTDAKDVSYHCNNYNIYKSTLTLPYPYPLECAVDWIANHKQNFHLDKMYDFAITDKADGQLYGAVGLSNHPSHHNGEIGYWIGEAHWGHGYGTEAARAVIEFAFAEKKYHKVYARHFASNPASGRIMQKCGMSNEGTLKDQIHKNNSYEDLVYYGIINPAHLSQ
ncbi:acetyltransferase [Paenibacillus sp. FSL R7-277]|uniref:GNAT family N-acetyltransferase n=1 Tax=Paenibacillus sp. FSL R7-277 TaxID=1227352 RepID=UPI0003E288DF|nr:GNAT family N-acetyltransferase [Paenibacillus sp. FSL R7-277]ETT69624.1 acetyltransferase [Paenibacillus sp. FSL R7-277]